MRYLCTAATATLFLASVSTANAQATGEFGLWISANVPHDTLDDGNPCDGTGTEFCTNTFGFGSRGAVHVPIGDDFSFLIDTTLDYHGDTDSSGASTDNLPALYAGTGVHAIYGMGEMAFGAFLFGGGASAAEDGDFGGAVFGAGLEAAYGDYFIQVGQLASANGSGGGIDGIDDLTFARIGGAFSLAGGEIEASAAVGEGDFDDGSGVDDGEWAQLSLAYNRPLMENMNLMLGYQGDYVSVLDGSAPPEERTTMHTFQIGINFLFGGGTDTPFSTPNFRAPLSYAGEFN